MDQDKTMNVLDEKKYVYDVYDSICKSFDIKRKTKPWKCFTEFIDRLPRRMTVVECGCGNGKNLDYIFDKHDILSFDTCQYFVDLNKRYNCFNCNICNIPLLDKSVDISFSLAVIHHLSDENVIKAISEMIRITRYRVLFSVLSEDHKDECIGLSKNMVEVSPKKYLIGWHLDGEVFQRYYRFFTYQDIIQILEYLNVKVFKITPETGNYFVEIDIKNI